MPTASILEHFSTVEAPHIDRQKKHQSQDIFLITLCAVISGADNWAMVEQYGKAKEAWLFEQLGLQHGIPSHGIFGYVSAANRSYWDSWISQALWRLCDAMGCQKKIARQVVGQDGDCVLGLKGNQGALP